MRLIAFSDSHRCLFAARKVVDQNPSVKHFVFLGDGAEDINELKALFPQKEFYAVRGNCDGFCLYPEELTLDFDGVKVFCTHGHRYGVKSDDSRLLLRAAEKEASVVLYGHTHVARCDYKNGIYLICPGSVASPRYGDPSYAAVDLTDRGILCSIRKL